MSDDTVAKMMAELITAQGLTLDDLARHLDGGETGATAAAAPTLDEWVTMVLGALEGGTRRSYATHYARLVEGVGRQCGCTCAVCVAEFDADGCCGCGCRRCADALVWEPAGQRRITKGAFTSLELEQFVMIAQRTSAKRALAANVRRGAEGLAPKSTTGQGGREMCVTALRHLFGRARDAELLTVDPTTRLKKGHRSESRRRALTDAEVTELFDAVAAAGDDPELDLLITWCALELGARRGGIAGMTVGALVPGRQTIRLLEKGNKVREQPCSAALIEHLLAHAARRGGRRCVVGSPDFDPGAAVLYQRRSTPDDPRSVTTRRFDTLHKRLQRSLPWANDMSFTAHSLRHTAGTAIERIAGGQVARVALGHARSNTTDIYTDATLAEVAAAVAILTGSPHPLAPEGDDG